MFEKVSTPILLALLIYHGYHYFSQWKSEKVIEDYKRTTEIKTPPKVSHDKGLMKPHIMKVSDDVYIGIGYTLANAIMLIGETGIVIVDTTESMAASQLIYEGFRKITDKPLKGIIYTHNHADHILGTEAFLNGTNPGDVEIWAYHTLMDIYFHSTSIVGPAHFYRSMHQFGGFLSETQVSSAFKVRLSLNYKNTIPPNKLMYKSQQHITIAGMDLRLIHIPGETDDQIAIFWQAKKVLLCADDFFMAFPNLYAIRGTPFRSLRLWKESLDIMRNQNADILVPSHSGPLYGADKIYNTLTDYRDAVQLVHDQTVRFMNQGAHPDEIADRIYLPQTLADKPHLQELYGTIKWSSKGLFSGYMGWFSGDIVDLNPHTPNEQAKRLIQLAGGIDHIITESEKSLEDGDPQWALRLSSSALRIHPTNQKAKEIKAKSLFGMAVKQTSMNGYNYYTTCAYTTMGKVEVKLPADIKKGAIRGATSKNLFTMLSLRFKAEECHAIDKVVLFVFPDTKQKFMFHVRNGVMDLSGTYTRKEDVKVTITSVAWKEILTGERSGLLSAVTSELVVYPSVSSLQEIMNCIEKV